MTGLDESGTTRRVAVTRSSAYNPAFDITPAALVSHYLTEAGLLSGADALATMLSDRSSSAATY